MASERAMVTCFAFRLRAQRATFELFAPKHLKVDTISAVPLRLLHPLADGVNSDRADTNQGGINSTPSRHHGQRANS